MLLLIRSPISMLAITKSFVLPILILAVKSKIIFSSDAENVYKDGSCKSPFAYQNVSVLWIFLGVRHISYDTWKRSKEETVKQVW